MHRSSLNGSKSNGPLAQAQVLGGGGQGPQGRESAFVLPLTSLIDAFSIIVIYLLVGTQGGGLEVDIPNKMNLPLAQSGVALPQQEMAIVRIEKGRYFINDKAVSVRNLGSELLAASKKLSGDKTEILIQADQKMDFADLDPLLRAGSEAGLQKLKFAVMPQQ